MVLAASPDGGKPMLVAFDTPPAPGTRVARRQPSRLIDSHCHLADDDVRAPISPTSSQRAQAAGVVGARCASCRPTSPTRSRARRSCAARGRRSRFAAAIHPHRAGAYAGRAADAAASRARRPRPTRRRGDRRDRARLSLRLLAARRPARGLRGADRRSRWSATCRSSSTRARRPTTRSPCCARPGQGRVRGVMHCFSGTREEARRALDLGFFISLSGILTFPKAGTLRDVARVRARTIACSSKPTRRFWRRCRIAASATSRRGWRETLDALAGVAASRRVR